MLFSKFLVKPWDEVKNALRDVVFEESLPHAGNFEFEGEPAWVQSSS
jgi:hypothetical protein